MHPVFDNLICLLHTTASLLLKHKFTLKLRECENIFICICENIV